MIFTSDKNGLDGIINKFGIFNKSFNNIKRDLSSGHGLLNSIFVSSFTSNDIKSIKEYITQIKAGVPTGEAWSSTMKGCTVTAKQHVLACKNDAKALEELSATASAMVPSVKAADIALKGLALAGNILVSLVISKVISTVYEMAQASDTVGKAAKEAADELITQRQNGVQFRIGKYNILAFHSTRISLHKIVELWNQIISKVGFSDISPTVIISHIRRRGEIGGSAKKVGKRIKELERLYGIQNGATSFQGNQYEVVTNKSEAPKKSQSDLAAQMGISVDTLQNYKMLAEMIPELDELVSTGIVTTHIKRGVPKRYPLQNLDIYMPKPYNQIRSNQGYVVCLMVALTETYVFPMWNKLVTRLSPICGRE